MGARLRTAVLAGCLAALMLAAPSAYAAFPGANGKIAFTHYVSSAAGAQIYTINPDGTGLTPLTSGPGANVSPAWSPDGQRIAFSSYRNDANPDTCRPCNTEIYVMNADGSNQTRLTNDPSVDRAPQWSPDGTKIVFDSDRTGGGDIYSMNAGGTGVVRLTTSSFRDADPSWSPDGAKIAFTAENTILRLMNPDGTNQTTVAGDSGLDTYAPDWSPDATRIAYQVHSCCDSNDNTMEVHTVHRDGTGDLFLGYNSTAPAWSPDGSRIAIADQECRYIATTLFCTSKDIITVNPDGSGRVNLTNNPTGVASFEPNWQPIPINSYPRPRGATPFRVSLVPAYKPCTAPNRTHGSPLAFGSCTPPSRASSYLTVGTPDANAADANALGFIQYKVKATSPEDLLITGNIEDVRCAPATSTGVCNSGNAADGPDYSGQLKADAIIQITDHYNGSGQNQAATVQEIPFPINFTCSNTADRSTGGTCNVNSAGPVVCPECGLKNGQRMVVQLGQVKVYDGGYDGQVSTTGDTLFMDQGVFIP